MIKIFLTENNICLTNEELKLIYEEQNKLFVPPSKQEEILYENFFLDKIKEQFDIKKGIYNKIFKLTADSQLSNRVVKDLTFELIGLQKRTKNLSFKNRKSGNIFARQIEKSMQNLSNDVYDIAEAVSNRRKSMKKENVFKAVFTSFFLMLSNIAMQGVSVMMFGPIGSQILSTLGAIFMQEYATVIAKIKKYLKEFQFVNDILELKSSIMGIMTISLSERMLIQQFTKKLSMLSSAQINRAVIGFFMTSSLAQKVNPETRRRIAIVINVIISVLTVTVITMGITMLMSGGGGGGGGSSSKKEEKKKEDKDKDKEENSETENTASHGNSSGVNFGNINNGPKETDTEINTDTTYSLDDKAQKGFNTFMNDPNSEFDLDNPTHAYKNGNGEGFANPEDYATDTIDVEPEETTNDVQNMQSDLDGGSGEVADDMVQQPEEEVDNNTIDVEPEETTNDVQDMQSDLDGGSGEVADDMVKQPEKTPEINNNIINPERFNKDLNNAFKSAGSDGMKALQNLDDMAKDYSKELGITVDDAQEMVYNRLANDPETRKILQSSNINSFEDYRNITNSSISQPSNKEISQIIDPSEATGDSSVEALNTATETDSDTSSSNIPLNLQIELNKLKDKEFDLSDEQIENMNNDELKEYLNRAENLKKEYYNLAFTNPGEDLFFACAEREGKIVELCDKISDKIEENYQKQEEIAKASRQQRLEKLDSENNIDLSFISTKDPNQMSIKEINKEIKKLKKHNFTPGSRAYDAIGKRQDELYDAYINKIQNESFNSFDGTFDDILMEDVDFIFDEF